MYVQVKIFNEYFLLQVNQFYLVDWHTLYIETTHKK